MKNINENPIETSVKDLDQSMEDPLLDKDDDSVKIIGDNRNDNNNFTDPEFINRNVNQVNINSHHSNSTREPSPKLNQNNMNLTDLADFQFRQNLDDGGHN